MNVIKKYLKLKEIISGDLVEREDLIKMFFLVIFSKSNILLIGPPGTGKSLISRKISECIKDSNNYEYLLTRFSTPEELFGPISLSKLKQDQYYRITDGYLPKANIGFLDEIFKANSSILNALLTIINEKIYHNGNIKEKVPIISIIGASNEFPLNEPELNALYDRFLFKFYIDYVKDKSVNKLIDAVDKNSEIPEEYKITMEEIDAINESSKKIKVPLEIKKIIKNIRKEINSKVKVYKISDRKIVQIINLLKVSAFLNGNNQITKNDLPILADCLWSDPNEIKLIRDILKICINE